MLVKTTGIVIRNTKYGEGSVISKIYTRHFGMQSYIINGIHGPKAAIKPSILQPMMLLDLVVYHNNLKDIQRIKEAKSLPQLHSLHFDVVKSGIAMFLSELLNKAIKEEEPNELLYDFTADYIVGLDAEKGGLSLWPLYFMLQLTNMLGFFPTNNFDKADNNYFDLVEGSFTTVPENNVFTMGLPESEYFSRLLALSLPGLTGAHIPKPVRKELLHKTIQYYKLHLPDFPDIKSVDVLADVG
jgi:DNA repair protein RecO (recombination protein O)